MQPYTEWEIVEERNTGSFDYWIMKVRTASGEWLYKGYLDGQEHWYDNVDLNALRMTIYMIGNQG